MGLTLRDYQSECLEKIKTNLDAGITRQLVALPTGTGKTVIFAQMLNTLGVNRMLVLAHREELLTQARDKILQANPGLSVGVEQGANYSSPLIDNVIVASVATLGRKGNQRLKAFDPNGWPVIICDEAHHSIAPTYKYIFDYFNVFDKGASLIGFTATPRRGDKVGLDAIYQSIVYQRDIRRMINDGWLCKIKGYRVRTTTDLTDVRVTHGDFVEAELSEAVNVPERNTLAAEAYHTYCEGRKALIFCVDKNHTREMAETFNDNGIHCGVVLGDTPPEERADTLLALADGRINAVANCMVLTEGFDLPSLSAIIMARPTNSGLLYTQCIGRATRLSDGKNDAVVVDLVDNSRKHSIASLASLFGLPAKYDLKGKSVTDEIDDLDAIQTKFPEIDLSQATSKVDIQKIIESFDLFRAATEIDELVKEYSRYIWHPTGDGYSLFMKDKMTRLFIKENQLGQHELTVIRSGVPIYSVDGDLPTVFYEGDGFITANYQEESVLYSQTAKWRGDLATPKQLELLTKLGVNYQNDITKGQASALISHVLTRR